MNNLKDKFYAQVTTLFKQQRLYYKYYVDWTKEKKVNDIENVLTAISNYFETHKTYSKMYFKQEVKKNNIQMDSIPFIYYNNEKKYGVRIHLFNEYTFFYIDFEINEKDYNKLMKNRDRYITLQNYISCNTVIV